MNLHRLMAERAEAGRPVGVGLIGAGKFGTMFLTQARLTTGMQIVGIADLDVPHAHAACVDRPGSASTTADRQRP